MKINLIHSFWKKEKMTDTISLKKKDSGWLWGTPFMVVILHSVNWLKEQNSKKSLFLVKPPKTLRLNSNLR